jgi:HEAT repeat protein
MSERKAKSAPPDQVDRAVGGIRRSVGRLVALLGDDDAAVVAKALTALDGVGPVAVGPLAAALPRAPSPRHRVLIITALKTFGPGDEAPALRALAGATERDPDERVRAAAGVALSSLMMAGMVRAR